MHSWCKAFQTPSHGMTNMLEQCNKGKERIFGGHALMKTLTHRLFVWRIGLHVFFKN